MRKIIHVDMDAFFAQVEQVDHPEWKGKPLVVGGDEDRGVIAAASYEARQFGVRSAMPSRRAKELCPNLIFAPHRFARYKEVSQQIREVFSRYTDLIEPLSLDEAFLDVTENNVRESSATFVAQSIKNDIYEETGLTASAGVSYCKFLAKMASDMDKPNGLYVIEPEQAKAFIGQLPIEKFFGVGQVTARKMNELGIYKGRDLLRFPLRELNHYFGKSGSFFYDIARGIDERPVQAHRERKSVGVERTFSSNLTERAELWEEAKRILHTLWQRSEKHLDLRYTLSVKIRFADFTTVSRSHTPKAGFVDFDGLLSEANFLIGPFYEDFVPIRLLGFSFSGGKNKDDSSVQMEMI